MICSKIFKLAKMSGKLLQNVGLNLRDKLIRQITIDSVRNRDVIMRKDLFDGAEDTETHTGQVSSVLFLH